MSTRCRFLATQAGGKLAFGSVGAGYSNLLASVQGRGLIFVFCNTLNQEVVLSLDAGTTDWLNVPAGYSFILDMGSNEIEFYGTISVKHAGTAPTSGFISCGVIRSQ